MATLKYRTNSTSAWQKLWIRITSYANEIFTSKGTTVEDELNNKPNYRYSTIDLEENTSELETGTLYFVYEE